MHLISSANYAIFSPVIELGPDTGDKNEAVKKNFLLHCFAYNFPRYYLIAA